ncbi:MAG: RluA family pseudouridine synthase [bacterium]
MRDEIIQFNKEKSQRLDIYLAEHFTCFSRTYFQAIIKKGFVTVNKTKTLSSRKLVNGDTISIRFVDRISNVVPEKISLNVIYEDADLLVINKPAGVVVHPACGHPKGTIVNGVLFYLGGQMNAVSRIGLVHRLDKETSGVLLIAKNDKAFLSLSKQFSKRTVKKAYLVLVSGIIDENEGVIEKPLGRSPHDRKKIAVVTDGRNSTTRFKVIKRFANETYLEAKPTTGRTHQIRVHLASIGNGVVGDREYNPKSADSTRMMLHAAELGIIHPRTKKRMDFLAPPPSEFCAEINKRSKKKR